MQLQNYPTWASIRFLFIFPKPNTASATILRCLFSLQPYLLGNKHLHYSTVCTFTDAQCVLIVYYCCSLHTIFCWHIVMIVFLFFYRALLCWRCCQLSLWVGFFSLPLVFWENFICLICLSERIIFKKILKPHPLKLSVFHIILWNSPRYASNEVIWMFCLVKVIDW